MKKINSRKAAVATIIVMDTHPEVLLLKRIRNPQDPWSGQYAFPGGRQENNDKNLLETCIRETCEECGIRLRSSELIKQYPVRMAGSSVASSLTPVTPYLFELPQRPRINLQPSEIASHEWLRVPFVADQRNVIRKPLNPFAPEKKFPCIPAAQGYVWGFTFETLMMVIADRYMN